VQDGFDCIDFTGNEIARLENFPIMKRLGTLLLSNNAITRIASGLESSLPRLHTVILTNNRIASLVELDSLAGIASLERLSLLHNAVTRRPHYRHYAIFRLPQLKMLDFQRIRKKERIAAVKFFSSPAGKAVLAELEAVRSTTHPEITSLPSLLGRQAVGAGRRTAAGAAGGSDGVGASDGSSSAAAALTPIDFSPEERGAIAAALLQATSAEAIADIESHLAHNKLPPAAAALLGRAATDAEALRKAAADAPVPVVLGGAAT
jgi:U2 small nuclear ribonucleoprotein A'